MVDRINIYCNNSFQAIYHSIMFGFGQKGLPLITVHYRDDEYGCRGYDTGVKVNNSDLTRAKHALVNQTAEAVRPHHIANFLRYKYRAEIRAAVEANGRRYNEYEWLLKDGELVNAIRRIARGKIRSLK